MPSDTYTRSKIEQIKTEFSEAHDAWRVADDLVHRRLRPVVDAKLGDMAAGADYRTPDLEEEEQRYIEFLSGVQLEFDARPGEDTPTGKEEAENAQLWFSRFWADINEGGQVQEMWSAGQVRHGLKVWRLLTRNLEEPDEGVDREEWMQTRDSVFYTRDANNTTAFWNGIIGGYNTITMEYELTVREAKEQYKIDGADIGKAKGKSYVPIHDLINASGVAWAGDEEDPDYPSRNSNQNEKITVTVCEYQDATKPCPVCPDKHPLWVGQEFVRFAGKGLKDAEMVREYTLPWKKWPSIRVTEGRTEPLSRDPHYHYRPLIIKLLVEAATWNWCNAMLLAIANRDMTQGFYAQLNTNMPDAAMGLLEGMSVPIPDNTTDQVDIIPANVQVWPSGLNESLLALRDAASQRFEQAKINPILFGEAYDEARQAPGTSFALLMRQARIPFNRPIVKQQQAALDLANDIKHAVLFFDHESDKATEQRIYVSLDGDEGGQPGEKVYLSASRLSTHPTLIIHAKAEQMAEQQAQFEADWTDYQIGLLDLDDLLKRRGHKDVEAYKKRLDMDRKERQAQPMRDNATAHIMLGIFSDVLDMAPEFLLTNPMQVQPEGVGAPVGGGNVDGQGNSAPAAITRASMNGQSAPQGGV